jgi:septum site-determining protein MinC
MAQEAPSYLHDPPPAGPGRGVGAAAALIKVRGTRDGLLLTIPDDARAVPPVDVARALVAHLASAESFFGGAEVIVDLGQREIVEEEVVAYRELLEERGVIVRGFTASSPQSREILRKQGYHPLHVVPVERQPLTQQIAPQQNIPATNPDIVEALYLRRTLRSGARVRHHGHLVIVGDVNPGAEVAASGDIIVWGVVRGTIHAGALGDNGAIICALGLTPTQLRIGSHYALPPSETAKKASRPSGPERARLEQGRLIVEPWNAK